LEKLPLAHPFSLAPKRFPRAPPVMAFGENAAFTQQPRQRSLYVRDLSA